MYLSLLFYIIVFHREGMAEFVMIGVIFSSYFAQNEKKTHKDLFFIIVFHQNDIFFTIA